MSTFLYFSYGSNMLTRRLVARCPSAVVDGLALAGDHAVHFAKPSMDGSGKATLVAVTGSTAYGVLFKISDAERLRLDQVEGRDYRRIDDFRVTRVGARDEEVRAATYVARKTDYCLRPFDWYADFVLAGYRQHGLPQDYVQAIAAVPFDVDPDPTRRACAEARRLLAEVGFKRD